MRREGRRRWPSSPWPRHVAPSLRGAAVPLQLQPLASAYSHPPLEGPGSGPGSPPPPKGPLHGDPRRGGDNEPVGHQPHSVVLWRNVVFVVVAMFPEPRKISPTPSWRRRAILSCRGAPGGAILSCRGAAGGAITVGAAGGALPGGAACAYLADAGALHNRAAAGFAPCRITFRIRQDAPQVAGGF